jgi:5,10-methenyltetrahydrofolate synthetase
MSEKSHLRKSLLAARKALAPQERAWRDRVIGERLLAWLEANPASSVGAYWPHHGEPDLTPIYPELAARGMQLALPVVPQRHAPLKFYAWRPGDELVVDAHGVMAPVERERIIHPELLLLPCVGFNAQRYRLGYGGGYYDRTLAVERPPRTVGIAYAIGEAAFEADTHDVAMDSVITETRAHSL